MSDLLLFAAKNFILLSLYVFVAVALYVLYKDVYRFAVPVKEAILHPGFLVEKHPSLKGRLLALTDGSTLGRDEPSDIIIEDEFISAEHIRFLKRKGNFFIEDLKSANGTLLNGSRINGEHAIFDGDVIKLGNTILRFMLKLG